ncbi:MAG: hypothetical protein QFB86_00595 [Patescibacteria group bacterium]|nr:hypothetical protein [Patescibacteria group bacterium]
MVDVSIPPAEHIDLNIEALHHLGTMAHENYEDDRAFSDEQDPEQEQ